jgi:hypothetical protein
VNSFTYKKVCDDRENKQQHVNPTRFIIEKKAQQKKIGIPRYFMLIQDGISCHDHRKKSPKIESGKNQWFFGGITEYI